MNKIKEESFLRGVLFDAVIIDGGAMLHSSVHWSSEGTVNDFVSGIERYIEGFLNLSDVNVIFDHYFERSIKSDTRNARIGNFRRSHNLSLMMELPPKDLCLKSTKTKENLIEIISTSLLERFTSKRMQNRLLITSKSICPE